MKQLKLSKDANVNYVASIARITEVRKHPNADRLNIYRLEGSDLITALDVQVGDLMVYMPVESKLSHRFLSETNSYRKSELNIDSEKTGFFEQNRRIRMIKLRGVYSEGFGIPLNDLLLWLGETDSSNLKEGTKFDTVVHEDGSDELFIKKHYSNEEYAELQREKKAGKSPNLSRLVDGQFEFHKDTENLRRNIFELTPETNISISYKLHGSNGVLSNILVKKKLGLFKKFLSLIGFSIEKTEHDIIYSSRRVVKNKDFNDPKTSDNYYDKDIWERAFKDHKHKLPKGYTVYGELVGFTETGLPIQKDYDYGCAVGEYDFYVFRITHTSNDGVKTELSTQEIQDFCIENNFKRPDVYFTGKVKNLYDVLNYLIADDLTAWRNAVLKQLELDYNNKDCYMCDSKVPEEGICVRIEKENHWKTLKLKSVSFLERETNYLDQIVKQEEKNEQS